MLDTWLEWVESSKLRIRRAAFAALGRTLSFPLCLQPRFASVQDGFSRVRTADTVRLSFSRP
jgi:hypothetical protein